VRRIAPKLALALLLACVGAELALQLWPGLLPRAYLERFPMHGVEFFHPDLLERTPVEGIPLPLVTAAHAGPPPADMIEMGVAPRDADFDARAFPLLELPSDELGLPNPATTERADLVLVGDSFGVALSVREPRGLQAALEEATGLATYNVSVAGVGPVQERWLVENVGLAKRPRAVLWFFFSGNDVTASYEPLLHRREGRATWAEAYAERTKPALVLPDLIATGLRSRGAPRRSELLPGFSFALAGGDTQPVWLHPDYLRQLGWSTAEWEAHPVWAAVQDELRAANAACAASGARLLLVYLPSKSEVLLPLVARDPALALRTMTALGSPAPAGSPDEVYDALLANRHALERVVLAFCERESIPFLSATPALEAQAARGELGYLVTDSHWSSVGQAALLEPLLAFLEAQEVIPAR